jgi:hypothetical protein
MGYLLMESIEDHRDNGRVHMPIRVASLAMLKLAILQVLFTKYTQLTLIHILIAVDFTTTNYMPRWSHLCYRSNEERKWAHTQNKEHLWRIKADKRNTHCSHLVMTPLAKPTALTYYKL